MVSPPAGMAEVKATRAREERMESFILTVFVEECFVERLVQESR